MGDRENVKLESLHKSSGEYKMVEKDIMRTAGGLIRGVTKVSLVCLRRRMCMNACARDGRACRMMMSSYTTTIYSSSFGAWENHHNICAYMALNMKPTYH